jgi:shikimate dehydrogenase
MGIDAGMIAIDVEEDKLYGLLGALDGNPAFVGGAVTIPYKECVARWLGDRLSPEAQAIGAVNCIYRAADGRLMGTNTDGEASLAAFQSVYGSVRDKSIFLMGLGGAGKAVAAYFRKPVVDSAGAFHVSSRRREAEDASSKRGAFGATVDWSERSAQLPGCDVVINCTSVGFGKQVSETPLSIEELQKLPGHAIVYDIIYQPAQTVLLENARKIGLRTLNGEKMNLEQAVLAFDYAMKMHDGYQGLHEVKVAMMEAVRQQA